MPEIAVPSSTLTITVFVSAKVVPPVTVAVTVTVAVSAFSANEFSSTVKVMPVGASSSSLIVPVASAVVMAPPTGLVNSTRKVSLPSSSTSSVVLTVNVTLPTPAPKSS